MQPGIDFNAMRREAHGLMERSSSIRCVASSIVTSLKNHFETDAAKRDFNLKIECIEHERTLANITYPLGKARFALKWGSNENGLLGVLVVEREQYDQYDNRLWEPVWMLHISDVKKPFLVNQYSDKQTSLDFNGLPEMLSDSVANVRIELVYGLIHGPKKLS